MNLLEPSFTNDIIWTIITLFALTIGYIVTLEDRKHD